LACQHGGRQQHFAVRQPIAGFHNHVSNLPGSRVKKQIRDVTNVPIGSMQGRSDDSMKRDKHFGLPSCLEGSMISQRCSTPFRGSSSNNSRVDCSVQRRTDSTAVVTHQHRTFNEKRMADSTTRAEYDSAKKWQGKK
jgi:hypothetical protein